MSKWKVVGMERDWEGDPQLPAEDRICTEVIYTPGVRPRTLSKSIPGTQRPDEVTYRLRLEKLERRMPPRDSGH